MADKPIELSNRSIFKLADGLRALDGVPEGEGKIRRFDFDDGIAWNIAKNLDIVSRAAELVEKQRKKLAEKHGIVEGVKVTPDNAEKVADFISANDALMDLTQSLTGILRLNRKDLQTGNKIPPSVFTALMPILTDG